MSVINTKSKCRPRSWCISPDGKQAVVGYDEGVLQVLIITDTSQLYITGGILCYKEELQQNSFNNMLA